MQDLADGLQGHGGPADIRLARVLAARPRSGRLRSKQCVFAWGEHMKSQPRSLGIKCAVLVLAGMFYPSTPWRAVSPPIRLAPASVLSEPPLPIVTGDTWRYFKGTTEPPAAWNTIGFLDTGWGSGPSGFGYGDGDDATVFSDMQNSYTTVYTRRLFDVPNPSTILGLEMEVDYDDGFVAYINGVEVARRNAANGTPPFNALATTSHEAAAGASGNPSETIDLNAFLGALVPGTNVIAVQGLNRALSSTDLSLIVELRQINAPPSPPSNPSPAPGATGVSLSPTLCVSVSDPDGANLTATFRGREVTGAPAEDFTIIALPDTQYYSASFPATYLAQTQWIVNNRLSRNIVFVTQLGDCVDNASVNQQLVNADAAWDIIEGNPYPDQAWGIPYGIAVGNHDQTPTGDPGTLANEGSTTTAFNTWFGVSRYQGRGYYAGHYGTNNDNHYELFSASGMDFVALHLEFMPADTPLRQSVLAWANGVLQAYPNRRAILSSHYLLESGTSTTFGNQGQATYDALKGNANLFLMMAGHLDQASRRSDTFNGHTIYTLKSDYQTRPNGGNGWLRILTFSPQNDTIQVQTYSPSLGQFINNHADNVAGTAQNEFVLSYDMDGGQPFVTIGSETGPSGGTICVPWPGREAGQQYEWYVIVSDGTDTTTGSSNTFTTAATCTVDAECADGNLCNGVETCGAGGTCQPGVPLDCDDADACTTDSCAPATGCQHAAVVCNDQNPCTIDTCDTATGCQYSPVSCPQGEFCNPQSGQCQPQATTCTTTLECDDGDPCTTDACNNANQAALSFDGTNDHVAMGPAPGLNASPAFTIEAWINGTSGQPLDTTGTNGISGSIPLFSKGGPEQESPIEVNMNYYLGLKAGKLVADFEDNVNGGNHPICGSTSIGSGWHHVAATYDGTTWALYVDGAAETLSAACSTCSGCTATPGLAPVANSTQHFALGTSLKTDGTPSGTTPGYYGGLLDEVRVWSVARSQSEIQAARHLELTSGTGIIGRWGLNEGAGLAASDSTAPGETGTLTNGPAWETANIPSIGTGTCAHTPISGCRVCNGPEECLDINVCNGTESCSGGVCQPGTPLNCDDGDVCTSDSCDPVDGCQHGIVNCSDGVACTADTCDSLLGCQHSDLCTGGQACNPATGLCETNCVSPGDCNDSNDCTNDACSGGFCVHTSNPDACNDGIVCTVDACDQVLGCLHTTAAGACEDGNDCTTDACASSNASVVTLDGSGDFISFGPASTHTELGAARFTLEAWINWDGTATSTTSTGSGGLTAALPIVSKGRAEADTTNQDMNYFLGIQGGKLAADFEEALGTCVGGSNPGASCFFSCSVTTTTPCSLASQCPGGETCTQVNGCTGGGTCDGVAGLNHPVIGSTTVTANAWHHAAVTYDGNCWQLYLDGTPDGAPVCTGNRLPRADSIQPFAIGTAMTSSNAAAGYFHGAIDEVRVWNYARSASQIRDAMNSSIRADASNPAARLIGRWGLDEGSGSTANDTAGYANSGTLTGNAAFATTGLEPLSGCVSTAGPDGTLCDDSNPCTSGDVCNAGSCTGTAINCDDGDPCTLDTCSGGSCSHVAGNNGAACNDGDPCTTADVCANGTCAGTPLSCDDNNPCTTDTCVGGDCTHSVANNGAPCTDSNACTTGDSCNGGMCVGTPIGCDDSNACTDDACVAGTCTHVNDDSNSCTDGNACTGDACVSGTCSSWYAPTAGCCSSSAECFDGNAATADTCVGAPGGTCSNVVSAACTTGSQCNDSSPCTTDACVGAVSGSDLNFDGTNDYVTMGAAAGETALGARAFTLEGWIRRDGASWGVTTSTGTGGVTAVPLITKGRGESESAPLNCNYFLGITAAGRLVADFEQQVAAGGWPVGQNHPICSTASIVDQQWHHIAASYSVADGWRLYLDGVEGTTTDGTTCTTCSPAGSCPRSPAVEPEYNSTQHFALGSGLQSSGAREGLFAGMMDEVRVWNLVRTPSQIAAGMSQEITSATGLIGRWGLGEGTGTTAADSTTPAQNGTLTESTTAPVTPANGPVWTTDSPVGSTPGSCTNTPVPGCAPCGQAYQCNDSNPCTTDSCSTTNDAALQFDGVDDYVTMGAAAGTSELGAAAFTVETWFFWSGGGVGASTGSGGIASLIPLVAKGGAEAESPANVNANYILGITGSRLAADFEDTATGLNHPVCTATTNPAITTNAWHHAAATYNGTSWKLYLDGAELTIDTACSSCSGAACTVSPGATPEFTSIQHFGLGSMLSSSGARSGFFQGRLDEVRVWNAARSLAQIQADQFREVGSAPNLIGRWSLNEGASTTAADSSGRANDGTLGGPNGPPVWSTTVPFTGNDACAHTNVANGASCSDSDPTTCGDVCGGGVCQGTSVPEPTPVNDSVRLANSATETTITWSDGAGPFNVYRGSRQQGVPWQYNQACFLPGTMNSLATDSAVPPPSSLYFYLISRVNSCRESTLGQNGSGSPVPNNNPCP